MTAIPANVNGNKKRFWDFLFISQTTTIATPGDAPHFVEVGEAGIAVDDATRRQRRVQLVG